MSKTKLDPNGLARGHVEQLKRLFGQRGPIGKDDCIIEIQRKAAQDEVIHYIEQNFVGRGHYVTD